MVNDFDKIILTTGDIDHLCKNMGSDITKDYSGKEVVFIGLLNGCLPFMSDLLKHVNIPFEIDMMKVSSYGEEESSSGMIKIISDITVDILGKDVIIIDEILDTGLTIFEISKILKSRGAKSVNSAVLMRKDNIQKYEIVTKYIGCNVENTWLSGYGLDKNRKYRFLPFVGILKK